MSNALVYLADVIFFAIQEKEDDTTLRHDQHYHTLAKELLEKNHAPIQLYDGVVRRYLKHISEEHSMFTTPSAELRYCLTLCHDTSPKVAGQVLKQMIRFGMYTDAVLVAEIVGRALTGDEILELVDYYTEGPMRSSHVENELLKLGELCDEASVLEEIQETFEELKKVS